MAEYSDSELLEWFRDSSRNRDYAFNLLVTKYRQRLYHHIRRMVISHEDADDLLQNTFIKVYHHLDGFRQESQLFTWMYRIATNECLGFIREKRKRFFLPIVDVEKELLGKLDQEMAGTANQIEKKLMEAILRLPEKQRVVFNLRYYDEMPYEEISQMLGTSVGALKASYHHAAKKVEQYLLETKSL
jgi:RNA polymerase sigma factor (sigma-70 family)